MLMQTDKQKIAELLAVLLRDNEHLYHVNKINDETVKQTEELLSALAFCNKASVALLGMIERIPKSTNVYGWLLSCGSAVVDIVKANRDVFYTHMLCMTGIQ